MTKIFIHGLGQTPESWKQTIEHLGGAEDCVCPDLAERSRGVDVTYGGLYSALSDECGRRGGSVALCGLSLGAVLALNYATDHPERVGALVLIAAQYRMPKALLKLQNLLFKVMPKSAFEGMGFPKKDVIALCKEMAELDFSDALGRISCPTLIVCGEKDSANIKAAKQLAEAMAGSRLAIVPGAGHELNVEAPEEFAALLRDFFASLPVTR